MPRSASPEPVRASSSSHRHRDDDRSYKDDRQRMKERDHESYSKRHRSEYDDRYESDRKHRHSDSRRRDDYEDDEERRRRRKRREREEKDREYDRKHRETSREREERKRRHKEKSSKRHRNGSDEDDDKKAERRAKAAETLLYTTETDDTQKTGNENGPNGLQSFTWAKKAERERKMGMTPAEARKRDEERRREAEEEIARLNQKRAEREKEQAIREEEESRMARLAESAAMAEWVAKEDDFYLEQSRKRAVIRVRENRAKPIDLLAINLKWINPPSAHDQQSQAKSDSLHPAEQNLSMEEDDDQDGDLEIDLEEPYLLFDNLDLEGTEELYQDIQMYLSLEKNDQNLDFWRSMIVVCDDTLADLRAAAGQSTNEAGVRSRIDPSVKSEMDNMLSSKSQAQLLELQEQVRAKLRSHEPIDVEYWEGLLKAIVVWRAKAKLRDLHEVILSNRLEHLRQRQRIEEERRTRLGLPSIEEERVAKAAEAARRRAEREAQKQYDDGSEDLFAKEAAKALEEDEEVFASRDEDLAAIQDSSTSNVYSWEDKYRPRKPRYFNKVHTGFEWNKYNQTHYDHDNPPPKQVQGYKFNIFYPDLIDKSKPPTFRIVKEKGNDETCLIIFEAGPPYETIAFRIVNKPWNMSHQRGFKAVFERGVLQLHFNFQRMFYRK
ncbi:uncharacterized protein FA14DRAFT_159945 [Meira miltonrushii]|uniref:Splicing factor Cactin n=1 Tax=Meira miltonrushii TaxID=1280837 RepID=A0A316VPI7_9BASI|nr:uncharacterized protein FA14DRAFT_159945 [Meira miltonrushii]PWN38333.1 hypothetical protein FA14DRAFT_159945 [Meira miltonrushii]